MFAELSGWALSGATLAFLQRRRLAPAMCRDCAWGAVRPAATFTGTLAIGFWLSSASRSPGAVLLPEGANTPEAACDAAESTNRAHVEPIPGVAIKHCNKTPKGRIVWQRPEDAPTVVDGVPTAAR
jgi:hypothetical protein